MNKPKRIARLEALIVKYQKSYYDGEAEISDGEFDLLWDELAQLSPDSPVIKKIGTGSDAAGVADSGAADGSAAGSGYTVDGFPKAQHLIPMGSQEKAANPQEFLAWAAKTGLDRKQCLVQYKLDGASLELQYEKGILVRAVTRGDGVSGDDISANARLMQGVMRKLKQGFTGGIRGEVLMSREVWRTKYPSKANCRNAANGIMRRKDGAGCEDLALICYDAAATDNDSFFTDELQKIQWLGGQGFQTSETKIFDTADAVVAYRAGVSALRDKLPFDIDGLVVKDRETDMADLRRARPEKQIAFKFDLETAFSILRQVEWSESGATYTPIGVVEPVRLAGTTVQRANLNNPDMIRAMGLKIGSVVSVVKRGEIIPKIEGLAPEGALPDCDAALSEIEFPTVCAACGASLVDAGTRLYCPNSGCPKRLLHRLEKWVSVLDIRELGEKLLAQLFAKARVARIPDLYSLATAELAEFERMGELSAAKVIRHINTPRTLHLAAFVAGFDFEGIAETTMEKIISAGFDSLEKLRSATAAELAAVHGIGAITAAVIVEGLAETAAEMDATLGAGPVSIAEPPPAEALSLRGLSFCFTGELRSLKRSQAEERIKALGGQTKASVVKDLKFLVTNDPESNSSKNKKARDLGVKIIGEEEFLKLIQGQEKMSHNKTENGQGVLFN